MRLGTCGAAVQTCAHHAAQHLVATFWYSSLCAQSVGSSHGMVLVRLVLLSSTVRPSTARHHSGSSVGHGAFLGVCLSADDQEPCRRVLQALSCFAAHTGMHRSSQIASDLAAISACSWLPSVESTQPTGHALATGQALQSLANACSRSDARGWAKAALRWVHCHG